MKEYFQVGQSDTQHLVGPLPDYVTAVVECEYPSIVSLLDAFDINESLEIWEVKPGSDKWDYAEPHTGEGIYKE